MLKRSLQAKRIKTSRDGDFTWRRSWINTIPNYLKKMTPKTKILLGKGSKKITGKLSTFCG
jgi:hypothetical protein